VPLTRVFRTPKFRSEERCTYLGVDLGQSPDPTAIAAVERVITVDWDSIDAATRQPACSISYDLRHLERIPTGTRYPVVCDRIRAVRDRVMELLPFSPLQEIVIDGTGVGLPVIDFLRSSLPRIEGCNWDLDDRGIPLVCIKIHGGDRVGHQDGALCLPKRDLVGRLVVLYQQGLIRVPSTLAEGANLMAELVAYRVKYSAEGHDSYNPQRSSQHDDELLAVACAVYRAYVDLRRRVLGQRPILGLY